MNKKKETKQRLKTFKFIKDGVWYNVKATTMEEALKSKNLSSNKED